MGGCLVLVLALAGCGGGESVNDEPTSATRAETTTTEFATIDLFVELEALIIGSGCTATAPIGTGSRLEVQDGEGTTMAVATFELHPRADSCHWRAEVPDLAEADFYTLIGDGSELVTVEFIEVADNRLNLFASVDGSITVAP